MISNYVKVGKIVSTFGLNGALKIYLYTDFADERFKKGNEIFIGNISTPNQIKMKIQSSKPYKNMYLLKFEDFDNINDVEKFMNYYLWVDKAQQEKLDDGEFYYHQIIDCKVVSNEGEDIGVIKEIISPGANDVWVVITEEKKEILIPYIDSVVKEVNVAKKTVIIELMEGLID